MVSSARYHDIVLAEGFYRVCGLFLQGLAA
jgi:hypothetical protein